MKRVFFLLLLSALTIYNCGVYTFNGSSLPSYLKTVDIPLFMNKSLEPNVADEVTQELNKQISGGNILRIISDRGDATITGTISGYSNDPYSFGTTDIKQVDVDQYIVKITADVEFYDNKKSAELFKGTVVGEGIYDFKTETEKIGKEKAEKDLVQKILEKSVQSW